MKNIKLPYYLVVYRNIDEIKLIICIAENKNNASYIAFKFLYKRGINDIIFNTFEITEDEAWSYVANGIRVINKGDIEEWNL